MHLGLFFELGASLFLFQRVNFHGAVEVLPSFHCTANKIQTLP